MIQSLKKISAELLIYGSDKLFDLMRDLFENVLTEETFLKNGMWATYQ